jgi:DNA-binding NtrC family response regulator
LRERPEDLPLLANHFLQHYWGKHRDRAEAVPTFSDSAIRAMRGYAWRGNVRELQNVIEHAVVLLEPGSAIRPEDIPFIDGTVAPAPTPGAAAASEARLGDANLDGAYHEVRDRVLAEFELSYLTHLVQRAGGNMSRAARLAGVDRTTLYRIMDKHGLQRETIMVEGD